MAKVVLRVTLPDELLPSLLQALRDWDVKLDPHHEDKVFMEQLIESDEPVEKMQAVFAALSPAMRYTYVKKFDS